MELFYREKGNPNLPTLIILHGLWGASDNWLPMAGLLSGQFHVILPDLPNHGNSPWQTRHDYETLSQTIASFIEGLRLPEKPFLAGHSMGGKALMRLLMEKPDIAAKAAILDISPKIYSQKHIAVHIRLLDFVCSSSLEQYQKREDILTLIRKSFPEEELYQLLIKNIRRTGHGFEWKINAEVIRENINAITGWPFLPIASTQYPPLLFIKGEFSDYIRKSDYPLIHQFFPEAIITTIPTATHYLHADQPNLLNEILTNFFLSP